MKISINHLNSFLENEYETKIISDALFKLGHEHSFENSMIIDLDITPNRGDCLSVLGIARDLNSCLNAKNIDLKETDLIFQPDKSLLNSLSPLSLNFKNKATKECPEIFFLEIEIENLPESYKNYLEDYFNDLNLNKNNFFADISNYLAYEIGQPVHCYDSELMNGEQLTLCNNQENKEFKTLLGNKIQLKGNDLVFKLNEKIVNIAGVMGDESTSCSSNTKKVLVECAYFIPEVILGKTRKYNLASDAAFKFERGADQSFLEMALKRFIKIIEDHTEIKSMSIFHNVEQSKNPIYIKYDEKKIENILGIELKDSSKTLNILSKLGFSLKDNIISPPSYRHDIQHINDIAEEIARSIGYNDDVFQNSNYKLTLQPLEIKNSIENQIRSFLVENNFNEVINYPFCGENDAGSLEIINPLDKNQNNLRHNLKNSLVKNLYFNERRQKDSVKLFEISDIYHFQNNEIKNMAKLGIIISGHQGYNFRDFSNKLDLIYLENLFLPLVIKDSINLRDSIQELKRDSSESKAKTKIFYFEIPIEFLSFKPEFQCELKPTKFKKYVKPSDFPSSFRDLSFLIKDERKIDALLKKLESYSNKDLKKSFLFDFYENKKKNEVKIAFRFIFQSYERTLVDKEVDNYVSDIVKSISDIEGIEIPGMRET